MKTSRLFLLIVFLIMLTPVSGCVHDQCLDKAGFDADTEAVRQVHVVIATNPEADRREIEKRLSESFDIFFRQTGIKFHIQDWKDIRWHASSRIDFLQQLADEMHGYKKQYDMAIGFYEMNAGETLVTDFFGGWMAAIDDVYRRYVILKSCRPHIVVHELGHAFLFEHTHTGGVMSNFQFCFAGDNLCPGSSVCFLDEDRKEISRNKWRSFSVMPELKEKQDIIRVYLYVKTPLRVLYECFR